METLAKIRLRYHNKKQPIKKIARELNISRNTVRAAIRKDQTANSYERSCQPAPKLASYIEQLESWLKTEADFPKSQRCSALKLYERLKDIGYSGAYDSVQRYCKRWKEEHGKIGKAYVPLTFSPGEAYQFDWSEETVELGGIVQKVKVAHFRLCHSRLFFVVAYMRETQEMLFDAHDLAFSFFSGIPERGIYDNMKTAIDAVFVGKERAFNRRFMQMMSHYLIEPTACTPSAGWEKGQVEKQVCESRQWLFTPRLKFANLANMNAHLREQCLELAKKRKHPEMKLLSVWEVYEQYEKPALKPLLPVFDGYLERACKVSSTCLIQFDRNRYSVDCHYASCVVSLRAYAQKIVVVSQQGNIIAEHERQFGRDKITYNPWHYVPLLERKPGALRNGAPFKDWDLPASIQKVCEQLMKRKDGDKQCVLLLQGIRSFGMEEVIIACDMALEDKILSSGYLLNLLNRLRPNSQVQSIPTPDNLQLGTEPKADCGRYDLLLSAGGSDAIH